MAAFAPYAMNAGMDPTQNTGPDVQSWKNSQQAAKAGAYTDLSGQVPSAYQPFLGRRTQKGQAKAGGQFWQGKGGAPNVKAMTLADLFRQSSGMGEAENTLLSDYQNQMKEGNQVNLQQQEAPLMGQVSSYVQQRLGTGLTPAEEAAIRSRDRGVVEGQTAQARQNLANRLTGTGIDPRSGLAMQGAGQIRGQELQGLTGVEQDITMQDLARKQQIENLASQTAAQEQQARQFDVESQQRRQALTEAGLGSLANLAQQRFGGLLDWSESKRQAWMRRQALAKAAKAAQPSGLENAASILGGITSGLGIG